MSQTRTPTQSVDKQLVAERFAASADTYDAHATIQRRMARGLVDSLLQITERSHLESILELGCGTGILTRELMARLRAERWIANDLVTAFAERIDVIASEWPHCRVTFLAGDMETLPVPAGTDLVVSNAAIQWLHDPVAFCATILPQLPRDGLFAFTTFGPGNLREFAEVTQTSLDYPLLASFRRALSSEGDVIYAEEFCWPLHLPSAVHVLRHLQFTGVNAVQTANWTRRDISDFTRDYERRFREAGGVVLTFKPIILVARR